MIQRNDLLIGYVNQALSSDQREKAEQILRESADARAELSELRQIQCVIEQGIRDQLDHAVPRETMNYAAIGMSIGRKSVSSRRTIRSNRLLANISAFAASLALIGALLLSLGSSNSNQMEGSAQTKPAVFTATVTATPDTSLPTLPELPSSNIEYNSSLPRRGADSPTIPTRTPTPVQNSFIQPDS